MAFQTLNMESYGFTIVQALIITMHSCIHVLLTVSIHVLCCAALSHSVVSNSLGPHGLQSSRLLCPWDSPGKSTGVGCHDLLQGIFLIQGLNPLLMSPAFAGMFFTTNATQEAQEYLEDLPDLEIKSGSNALHSLCICILQQLSHQGNSFFSRALYYLHCKLGYHNKGTKSSNKIDIHSLFMYVSKGKKTVLASQSSRSTKIIVYTHTYNSRKVLQCLPSPNNGKRRQSPIIFSVRLRVIHNTCFVFTSLQSRFCHIVTFKYKIYENYNLQLGKYVIT